MSNTLLLSPNIKALNALVSLGICSLSEDQLEIGDKEYSFEIQPDNVIDLTELQNLKEQFQADELKIGYYCHDGQTDDVRLAIDLYFKSTLQDKENVS